MHAIDKDTVHRLCSGQVIVDLATAVKELLENGLDAGATLVDIKMKDSGLTSISVSDNGQGIKEEDRISLCRKHWTSKISSFEDLEGVDTFGFRGEALSSLCAVSKVIVTTATEETAPMGVQLEYDGNGELAEITTVARERGTTVTLTGLFTRWPVRLQDLKKNIRREYLRLVGLVEQYAIISDQARITMSNQTKSGITVAVRTPPQADRMARLVAVLGAQVRPHMTQMGYRPADSAVADDDGLELLIEGNISKPIPEAGRSGSDKQYFFVNGRPCDFPKAKKLVNESFRSHCPTKYPVFAISISINATTIDVNLTPDKRTILIRHEAQLLAALKEALANVLEPQESMFSVNRVQTQLVAEPTPRDNPDRRNVVSVRTSVPGVVMCYVEDPKSKVVGGSINNKRPSGHDADFNPPPSAASRQRLVEHMGGVISRPQPASVSRPVGPKPTSKKLPSIVIGTCRNRMQNDEHDWQGIAARLREKQERRTQMLEESQQGQVLPDEYADIDTAVAKSGISETNPEDASSALSQLIHKTDFARMSVIGQFNRGFIIARLNQDLYIIDQHASDEKYNFEQLQQRAVISSQPLIRPAQLELSIVDEGVAIEHKETLMRNGFHVRVDDTEAPGRKVSLLSQPFIDQTLFNQQDLLELVGKLCINPESMPRCERARKMFASRACRRSTMIGDSLSLTQMKAIVRHLSDLDHPWNCPHGRPTMRHLHRLKD
ncbi:ATP-binding mismatch repair protein [Kickxella alabastrina]|uniref:ATP-binding mismatch repair protein n=1 Tax=Kickxella alabastrina TaxID=61397 RepID=A0ACC1I4K7_9FUNG|nr:ATP-binding mismatch repair protein [Kickxella alabastrina]